MESHVKGGTGSKPNVILTTGFQHLAAFHLGGRGGLRKIVMTFHFWESMNFLNGPYGKLSFAWAFWKHRTRILCFLLDCIVHSCDLRLSQICSSSGARSLFIQSLFISSLRMKAEIKLAIQPCFPHTTRLMVIIRIQLMISLSECNQCNVFGTSLLKNTTLRGGKGSSWIFMARIMRALPSVWCPV